MKFDYTLNLPYPRTYVNSVNSPQAVNDGARFYDIEKRTIFEKVNGTWIVKYCNKSCLPMMDVAILDEGLMEKL